MKIGSLEALFDGSLRSLYDVEHQLAAALPAMANASATPELRQAFEQQLADTKEHGVRLQEILKQIGVRPEQAPNLVLKQMIEGIESLIRSGDEGPVRDVALIMAASHIKHFEIALCGSLRALARVLGKQEIADFLGNTREGERDADRTLAEIGEQVCLRAIHEEAASSTGIAEHS
jgi:ferritin-like metal-binding protein YciE